MKLFGCAYGLRQLSAIILLICSPLSLAAEITTSEMAEEDLRFWEEWNAFFSELIQQELATPDPWEPLNRKVFAFNDFADTYVLVPVAKGYQWVTPDVVEKGIGNVFDNIFEVTVILNDLLQFKFGQAASDTGRFVVNSTVGVLGIFDVATSIGLEKHNEDFGQTLGYWGMGPGPYVVVPILGSYTFRDGVGSVADGYTDYFRNIDHVPTRNSTWVVEKVHNRSVLLAAEDLISGDRYTFIRDAYLQQREYLVKDGVIEDSFGEEDFDESWDDDEDWEE